MKKNYFSILFAALMLFVAMPAKAQVTSVTEFFGKWQFTADVDVKNQDYANLISNSCEVVITKGDNGYPAKMTNFAGSTEILNINSFDADAQTLLFLNPNTPQLWAPLFMADGDGKYPYGTAEGGWQDSYGQINFTYDAATGILTYPDFTLVTADHNAGTTEVMVKVSNIRMTLIEAEEIVIPEIAGEWKYSPYYWDNDSTFVKEFKMTLVATDDTNTKWNATFSFEGFEEFTLPATFDGVDLIIPFDNLYLDAEKTIRFGIGATSSAPENVFVKSGRFAFAYSKKTMMWQDDAIYIRKEGVDSTGTAVAPLIQRLRGGWIEREDPNAFDWSGTYTVNVKDIECFTDSVEFPNTFNMVIEKSQGSFTVTEFAGYKSDYYPSIELIPGEDGKTATLDLAGYYGFVMLASLGEVTVDGETDYAYHILADLNGQSTSLTLSLNEDGSVSIDDFSVFYQLYYANTRQVLGMMSGVTASKVVYEWAGEYTLTATVENLDTTKCASEFDVKIEKIDDVYYITQFDGDKVYALNYGGIEVEVTGNNTAKFASGCLVNGAYPMYITLDGVEDAAIEMTMDNAGNIAMADFFYNYLNYETYAVSPVAKFTNVVLTKKADNAVDSIVIEKPVVEGIFDMMGRKHDAITAPGLYIVNGKKVLVK